MEAKKIDFLKKPIFLKKMRVCNDIFKNKNFNINNSSIFITNKSINKNVTYVKTTYIEKAIDLEFGKFSKISFSGNFTKLSTICEFNNENMVCYVQKKSMFLKNVLLKKSNLNNILVIISFKNLFKILLKKTILTISLLSNIKKK